MKIKIGEIKNITKNYRFYENRKRRQLLVLSQGKLFHQKLEILFY